MIIISKHLFACKLKSKSKLPKKKKKKQPKTHHTNTKLLKLLNFIIFFIFLYQISLIILKSTLKKEKISYSPNIIKTIT